MHKDPRKQAAPCPNCPDLLDVLKDVLAAIQTETSAPLSITDNESRELLHTLELKLKAAAKAHGLHKKNQAA